MKSEKDERTLKIGLGLILVLSGILLAGFGLARAQPPDRGDLFLMVAVYCGAGSAIYSGAQKVIGRLRARIAELEAAAAAGRPE